MDRDFPSATFSIAESSAINKRKQIFNVMASQAQIAANGANALKSTGPTSEAGKRRIASNALKHGLYSDSRYALAFDKKSNPAAPLRS